MIATDYELSKPLASALKAKAPFVGVPLPGHRPLIFKRVTLQRMLRCVRVLSVAVDVQDANERFLIVRGVSGTASLPVRCRYRIRSTPMHEFWERGNRRTCERFAAGTVKVSALDRKIARLTEERSHWLPRSVESTIRPWYENERLAVLAWYQMKPERRQPQYRDTLARINAPIAMSKPWCLRTDNYSPERMGPERYSFLKSTEYLAIREELRGLLSVRASREQ